MSSISHKDLVRISYRKLVKGRRYFAISNETGKIIPFIFKEYQELPEIIYTPEISLNRKLCVEGKIERRDSNEISFEYFKVGSYILKRPHAMIQSGKLNVLVRN